MRIKIQENNTCLHSKEHSLVQELSWDMMLFQLLRTLSLGILIFSCLFTMLRSINWPLIHDAPLLHFIATEILTGKVPYKDMVDMNMPGTYLLHMLVLKVLGPSDLAWRLFDLLWLGFSTLGIVLYTRTFGMWTSAFASLMYLTFHLSQGPLRMGQRDFLMIPFIMFAAHYFARNFEDLNGKFYFLMTGMFIGSAFIIKPFSFILLVFFTLFFLGVHSSNLKSNFLKLAFLYMGASVVPILTVVWLFSVGALPSLWTLIIEYLLPFYNGLGTQNLLNLIETIWRATWPILPAFLLILALLFWNRSIHANKRLAILFLCTVYGIFHFLIQGKGWGYHLEPFCYFFFTLGIVSLAVLINAAPVSLKLAGISAIFCTAVITGGQALASVMTINSFVAKKQDIVRSLVKDIERLQLTSSDTIQVLDTAEGGIHSLLKLGIHLPTRFIYDFHFYHNTDAPFIQELRKEFINSLAGKPPQGIVLFHFHWLTPDGKNRVDQFPELSKFLEDHYYKKVRNHDYTLYAQK